MVTMHHAVSDGWSIGILIRELSALYQSFLLGQPSPLPELAIQYADYAVWQRNWLEGAVLEAQLDYWTRQLAGVPDLELPTDRPRPPVDEPARRRTVDDLTEDHPRSCASTRSTRGRDSVHDAAGGVSGAPLPLLGAR